MNDNRWRTTIQHVKQYKQVSDSSVYVISMDSSLDEGKSTDELSIIMNIYAERLAKNRNGSLQLTLYKRDGFVINFLLIFLQMLSSCLDPNTT